MLRVQIPVVSERLLAAKVRVCNFGQAEKAGTLMNIENGAGWRKGCRRFVTVQPLNWEQDLANYACNMSSRGVNGLEQLVGFLHRTPDSELV